MCINMLNRLRNHRFICGWLLASPLVFLEPARVEASTLRISASSTVRAAGELEADYTTTHVSINEVAHESVPITIFFDPQMTGVAAAEIFSNLNRRDRAARDADGDGIDDGIKPPSGNSIAAGDDRNYYKVYPMQLISGGYQLTLSASNCGAYRLTARYRLNGETPNVYHWYGSEMNGQGIPKRDHAIVVSPTKARNVQSYETPLLTVLARGSGPGERGTFSDMAVAVPSGATPHFSFSYLKSLGCNTIWLLPIHPVGIDGREKNPATGQPYQPGSPYSVKNFFAVAPLLSKSFSPGPTPADNDTPAGRNQAMKDFQRFVKTADAQGINVMLDAPFNHSAHDAELASSGQKYWGNGNTPPTLEIRNVEARFYSRVDAYDMRAMKADTIAPAPDRYDFGKWSDTSDIYFGRYAALVPNQANQDNYRNEADWFDYSVGSESASGDGNGHFDAITENVWRYFGDYLQFWLTQTGYPSNAAGAALNSDVGVDGLRGDFGQGLPPQCWEYVINRTRSRKWNFVFMAETLDGGAVTYRSSRHFDIVNDSLFRELRGAQTAGQFRDAYESRINGYSHGLVLLNTGSHDEDSFKNPFEGLVRFAVNCVMSGVSSITAGQEMGLRGAIVPPGTDSSPGTGPPFGYDQYFAPFAAGKLVPQFMVYNSMMPLWRNLANNVDPAPELLNLYGAVGRARASSAALRSDNHVYLNLKNGQPHNQIFSVAKFQRRNANPSSDDVVFAFVNLTVSSGQTTTTGNWFDVNVDRDQDGVNDFGIQPAHIFNVKNIAAYTGVDTHRSDAWLWSTGRTGSDLLQNGIFVQMNAVPGEHGGWAAAPYEAQYLKLFDVTKASNP
jgi:glycosidase